MEMRVSPGRPHFLKKKGRVFPMNVQKHFIRKEAGSRWLDATPMGTGFLGAMVYGHTAKDRIQLNEDSLWHGKFRDRINPNA